MDLADLEREVDRALQQLPAPRAPGTLAPRVMQAIALQETPAVARTGWRSWPLAGQMLALAVACSIAAAIAVAVPVASAVIANTAVARAAAALWQMFFGPMVTPVLVVVTVMCTACALLLAGLKYVAWPLDDPDTAPLKRA